MIDDTVPLLLPADGHLRNYATLCAAIQNGHTVLKGGQISTKNGTPRNCFFICTVSRNPDGSFRADPVAELVETRNIDHHPEQIHFPQRDVAHLSLAEKVTLFQEGTPDAQNSPGLPDGGQPPVSQDLAGPAPLPG